jgi:hypothetical protein
MSHKPVVLMGDDLPLRYEDIRVSEHGGSPDTVEVALVLKRADDSDDLVTFVIPRGKLADVADAFSFFSGGA